MTLDEMIAHAKEAAKLTWNGKPTVVAEESQQLAEWLKDYKRLLDAIDAIKTDIKSEKENRIYKDQFDLHFNNGLDKALEIIEKHISGKETE